MDLATAPDAEFEAAETTEIAGPRVAEKIDPAEPDGERYANGGALPGPDATLAGPTFEEWLAAAVPAARALSVLPDGEGGQQGGHDPAEQQRRDLPPRSAKPMSPLERHHLKPAAGWPLG